LALTETEPGVLNGNGPRECAYVAECGAVGVPGGELSTGARVRRLTRTRSARRWVTRTTRAVLLVLEPASSNSAGAVCYLRLAVLVGVGDFSAGAEAGAGLRSDGPLIRMVMQ
jgi:hypothetical protein